jgi:hypothetical protein
MHSNVQSPAVPVRVRMVLASPMQASDCAVHDATGSHFSPGSTTPLPHAGAQLLSLLALQPGGQQPSLLAQAVCSVVFTQAAVQAVALPCSARSWQPTGGQDDGQLPSQVSAHAASVTPLPQRQLQSLSLTLVQPDAQQPSLLAQAVITASFTQRAVQAAAVPCSLRVWQPTAGHADGQLPSQISPASTTPLPQRGAQSPSLVASQAGGQQPSGAVLHAVCRTSFTHWAWQVLPLTRRRS